MNDKIEIPLSKTKLFLGIGIAIIFLLSSIWLFTGGPEGQTRFHPLLLKIVGILGFIFGVAVGVYGIRKLFDKKAGLIIDEDGITDNSNGSSVGLIEWVDITGIKTTQVMSTKILLIEVDDPAKYIAKAKNSVVAKLLKSNYNTYGTPVSITSNTLQSGFEDLAKLVNEQFEKYKTP